MSRKRYAILAAVSQQQQLQQQQQQQNQQQHHQQQHPHNATVMSTASATTTTTTATTIDSASLGDSEEELLHSQELGSSSSIIPYYNGGVGLYNQQRGSIAGGGASGPGTGSGSQTYAHVVNGSVNLLLGGSMLCLVTTILCVVCYCCHRNIKKRTEAAYRQQQHQWMENDPNMEIYSVEQCYETSGLFLGDSTDGLAALPALHHEPPPSYDAVVLHEQQLLQQQQQQLEEQQLQLQQQQMLLQRVSPPPGYRSTLDISSMQQAAASASGSLDAMAGGSNCAGAVGGASLASKQLQRTLNAQSCCSLQRAEVENMWNAAAAAVAARNGNCQEREATYMASPTLTLQARKHAQAAMRLNSFGRRYLQHSQYHMQQHSHYRRGCPLCGKFRYAAEDETLAASLESGLEQCDNNENVAHAEHQQLPLQQPLHPVEQQQTALANGNGNQIAQAFADTNGNVVDSDRTPTEQEAAAATSATAHTDENDNAAAATVTESTPTLPAVAASSATETTIAVAATAEPEVSVAAEASSEVLNMNNINENGIISLDMSKIIDISGLPTYEGAIQLESSGYV